jgi:hypothetical protein
MFSLASLSRVIKPALFVFLNPLVTEAIVTTVLIAGSAVVR